ncbi:MAG: hypothetical protein JNM18_10095 [Planctomycetaceae bacterium]|nr:hypothetical protein [Planctomycetaceae bacterium]
MPPGLADAPQLGGSAEERAQPTPQITEAMMRFYQQQHGFYCGVDLHAKTMHVRVVNQAGDTLAHQNIETRPERFLQPSRQPIK